MRGKRKFDPQDADLSMEVMLAMDPMRAWSINEIAEVTGMSPGNVWLVQKRALNKIVRALERQGIKVADRARLGSKKEHLRTC